MAVVFAGLLKGYVAEGTGIALLCFLLPALLRPFPTLALMMVMIGGDEAILLLLMVMRMMMRMQMTLMMMVTTKGL